MAVDRHNVDLKSVVENTGDDPDIDYKMVRRVIIRHQYSVSSPKQNVDHRRTSVRSSRSYLSDDNHHHIQSQALLTVPTQSSSPLSRQTDQPMDCHVLSGRLARKERQQPLPLSKQQNRTDYSSSNSSDTDNPAPQKYPDLIDPSGDPDKNRRAMERAQLRRTKNSNSSSSDSETSSKDETFMVPAHQKDRLSSNTHRSNHLVVAKESHTSRAFSRTFKTEMNPTAISNDKQFSISPPHTHGLNTASASASFYTNRSTVTPKPCSLPDDKKLDKHRAKEARRAISKHSPTPSCRDPPPESSSSSSCDSSGSDCGGSSQQLFIKTAGDYTLSQRSRNKTAYPSSCSLSPARRRTISTQSTENVNPPLSQLAYEFSYQELVAATRNFHSSRKLGKGACGKVYLGFLPSGTEVAIKRLKANEDNGFEDEVRILSFCRHPNLVTLIGWATHEQKRFVVYEYLPGGDVAQKLSRQDSNNSSSDDKNRFGWSERFAVALEVTQAVAFLHGRRPKVFHRDIKTANILLNSFGTAKLADFGLACVAESETKHSRNVTKAEGTPGYADDAYVETLEINEAREVYSLGMLYLELLTSQPPASYVMGRDGSKELQYLIEEIDDITDINCVLQVIDPSLQVPMPVAHEWGSLALQCIACSESERPTSAHAVSVMKEIWKKNGKQPQRHRLPSHETDSDVESPKKNHQPKFDKMSSLPSERRLPKSQECCAFATPRKAERRHQHRPMVPRTPKPSMQRHVQGKDMKSPSALTTSCFSQEPDSDKMCQSQKTPRVIVVSEKKLTVAKTYGRNVLVSQEEQQKTQHNNRMSSKSQISKQQQEFFPQEALQRHAVSGIGSLDAHRRRASIPASLLSGPLSITSSLDDRLFNFDLIGGIQDAMHKQEAECQTENLITTDEPILGARWDEVWLHIHSVRSRLSQYLKTWQSAIHPDLAGSRHQESKWSRASSMCRLLLNESANGKSRRSNGSHCLSIQLHTVVFGRKRSEFGQQLKSRITTEWFGCISRQHFSISILLTGCSSKSGAGKKDKTLRPKSRISTTSELSREQSCGSSIEGGSSKDSIKHSGVPGPQFDIEFKIRCLSSNGVALNESRLTESDEGYKVIAGDVIHIFDPQACRPFQNETLNDDGSSHSLERNSSLQSSSTSGQSVQQKQKQHETMKQCIGALIFRPNPEIVQKLKHTLLSLLELQ